MKQDREPAANPVDVYNILNKLPLLQDRRIMDTINARLQKRGLVRNWTKIVGPKLAEHTRVATMCDQKLIVLVDELKWLTALQQMEKILNEKVTEFLKPDQPVSIVFRLGKLSFSKQPRSPGLKTRLTSGQTAKIEDIICSIKDNDNLKRTLKNILIKHCRRNRDFLDKN